VAGGLLGILLTLWAMDGLLAIAPSDFVRLEDVSVNLPVLLFSLIVVCLVAIALGLFSATRATSDDLRATLNEGSHRYAGTPTKRKLGGLIVAAQLAITLVLLVGAGLLGRSLLKVLSVDPGFRVENVLTMDIGLPVDPTKFQPLQKFQRIQFLDELFRRLRQIPGVKEVGGTNVLPLTSAGRSDGSYVLMNSTQISPSTQDLIRRVVDGSLEKDPALLAEFTKFFNDIFTDKSHLGDADYCVASDGFFKSLNIPLLNGRYFDERDTIEAPQAAIISQSLAYEKWPNQNPLGQSIEFGNMDGDPRLLNVVGVVGDIRDRSLEIPARPVIYVSYRQRPQAAERFTIVMLASGQPDSIYSSAREILRTLDPDVPPRFGSLLRTYAASVGARRFSLILVGIFSGAALLLAIAGIYGVTSYSVTQRTREIGVRMALGARAGQVLVLVLGQAALTSAVGVAIGILGSLVLARWLQSQLFGVSPTDPATFIGVALLLTLVTLAACYIPARRATKVDPMIALRYE
jgi:putative ABC transport system permease protein